MPVSNLVPVERVHAAGPRPAREGTLAHAHTATVRYLWDRIVSTTGRHQFYTVRIVAASVPAFKAPAT